MTTRSEPSPRPSRPACEPRLLVAQPHDRDLAEAVAQAAGLMGYSLLPWQVARLRDWSAVRPGGAWVHRRVGESVPRQAGKSVNGIVWVSFLAAVMGYKVLWTDHNYSTTCEMLRRFKQIFGERLNDPNCAHRHYNRAVAKFHNQTSQEYILMRNGGMIAFSTRTKSAALGFSFDVVVFDEAQELTDEQAQAIMPTTSSGAKHNVQTVYLGTPTRAGSSADSFSSMREEAVAGGSPDLTWCEYGIADLEDAADEEKWYTANPCLGLVTTIDSVRLGMRGLSPLAFAQEYLGYWLPRAGKGDVAIDEGKWAACLVPDGAALRDGRLALGVKFTPDGDEFSVSAAVVPRPVRGEGPPARAHVELIDTGDTASGTEPLVALVLSMASELSTIVIDGRSNAQTLHDRLAAAGVPKKALHICRTADAVAAATRLMDEVKTGTVTHIESPPLDESAAGAVKRKIGESGIGFGDGPGAPSHPVESAALALWGARTTRRDPKRKMRAI